MTLECKCPKCGYVIDNPWDYSDPEEDFDEVGGITLSYRFYCLRCRTHLMYTEAYHLTKSTTEEI